ncbi:biliverdin-producing heme oxygenase [Notoacmeibacter ruber]|nr:biliverdin-producing heme oxygenase [Notoacmeibacter ruber]
MALRDETRHAHQALDDEMSAFRLDDAKDYAAFLATHAAVLPAYERALEEAGIAHELPDWSARQRRQALAEDLAELPFQESVAAIDIDADLSSPAARLGAAYVLEGSRMGARLLMERVPQGDPRFPTRFLGHGQGERLWAGFVSVLDEADKEGISHGDAVNAARHTFEVYQRAAMAQTHGRSNKTLP